MNKDLITAYTAAVRGDILTLLASSGYQNPEEVYNEDVEKLTTTWPNTIETLLRIVSAKNYLMPLLQFRMNHCLNRGKALVPTGSIKLFLANHADLSRLGYLKDRIR